MDPLDLEEKARPKKRSRFLSVLCILSFIGITYALISSGAMLAAYYSASDDMTRAFEELQTEQQTEFGSRFLLNTRAVLMITIIANLVCLIGVLRMWKLRKDGFYIYAVGEIAPAVATIWTIGIGYGSISSVIPIIFIVLYATNLNQLK